MVKVPFHIKHQSTVCLLAAALIYTLLLCGCSGGGGGAAVTPLASETVTNGLLKLGTVGTTTNLIGGLDLQVNLPAGVTVDADPSSGQAATGAVTLSGAAAGGGNSLVMAKYAPAASGAPATLHIVMINAAGFHPGEFVTVKFNMATGASFPALNAFTITNFSATGLDNSVLSGMSAAPLSVAAAGKAAAVKQVQAQLVVPGDQNFLTLIVDTPTNNSTNQTIKGTLQSGDNLTVTVNGTTINNVVITGGAWSAQISGLVEGANIIAVTETDTLGNVVASVPATTLTLDTQKPNLNVNNALLYSKYSHIAIGGTVDDIPYHIVTLDVKCDSATVDMATAAVPVWSAIISNLSYGDNICHVTATDLAGNHDSKDVHIHYDNLVPDLDIYYNALVKYGIDQYISGIVESGIKPVMTVNGYDYAGTMTVSGSNWNCKVGGLVEGPNTITVTATDSAGNVATRTATITTIAANGSFGGLSQPSVADALKALRIAIGFYQPTAAELLYGDLYDDGNIDLADAILILRKVVGLPDVGQIYGSGLTQTY